MPLFKRTPFTLLNPPRDLEPHELVFQVRFTKEIFRDYLEYLNRINLYRKRVWTCKVTGKTNLTYEEALVSEQRATEKVQGFPEELIRPVLQIVQFSMLPMRDLLTSINSELQNHLFVGMEVQAEKDGLVLPCKITKLLDKMKKEKTQYEVVWLEKDKKSGPAVVSEEDIIRKKLPYTRDVLRSFIKESTYRNAPWVIHQKLASKYGIATELPEDLKGKITVLNGCVVSCKNKRKHEVSDEGESRKSKKNKVADEKSEDGDDEGKVSMKYPIDDLLVQPTDDDTVLSNRPLPARDFSVPVDCVGHLLMVWDFCSSFGRLLHLWPFSLEDFEKAVCHKESNITLIVETHSVLLSLLIRDEGEYYMTIKKEKRKPKITRMTWTEYLCDFLEMIDAPVLSTNTGTIRRGHYGLLDAQIKLGILQELVTRAIDSDILREKLDEYIEQRRELGAAKRGEALEEGKKRREAKELLKASEASNLMSEGTGNNGHMASNGRLTLQDGSALEKASSQLKHMLENGKKKHDESELRKMTKKLMEEMEKKKEQRKEFLEKELEKRVIRTNSLGKDRDYNRYWFFRREGRVFVEGSDSEQWGYYGSKDELDAFMASLNVKGVRERALKGQLEKFYDRICLAMQKRSKDTSQKIEAEEAAVRRSTRVRAPPRMNPALAFLSYTNKWKEE